MVTNLMAADSIGFGQFVRVREIRVMAPTVLILEEKLAKGVWEMRGWTAREHRGGRDGRP
jgi:hypothetical protein